ncbi:fimbrial protein [Dyella kyungheensis]|jgi:type 1 fimbria pilin|uniref:fimbrial protein n=1 Tax=Dyella kyungheensis TaxID=1242174 RepID=UPI003CF5EE88
MNKFFRSLLLVVCAVVFHGYAPKAHAAFVCATPGISSLTAPAPAQVDTTLPVGATLWTGAINVSTSAGAACSGGWPAAPETIDFKGSMPYLGGNIYDSGIPGIGYTVQFTGGGCNPALWPVSCTSVWGQGVAAHQVTVKLIKTGAITRAGSVSGEFAHWEVHQTGNIGAPTTYETYVWSGSFIVTPKSPTCQVTSSSPIAVTLPDQSADGFSGVGTTAGTAQNFNINLSCSGGDPGSSSRMYITLTDATNPGNTTDMLSPTAATASTGVGVRIFNGSLPVKYGPDSVSVGNTNQWQVTTVNAGSSTVSIPLTAQYVQVGSTVQGGPVAAIATFTMAYN